MWFETIAAEAHRLGLTLRWGAVPTQLTSEPAPRRRVQVAPGETLVRLDRGWSVLVSDGADIVLHGPPGAESDNADEWGTWVVDTWAIPIAMMQRGFLILHASTVLVDGVTIAVAGNSGAGKSTTAWGLRERGHGLLVDETTICEVAEDCVLVHPFRRRLNLTEVATAHFGITTAHTRPSTAKPGKVSINPDAKNLDRQTLGHVVVLNRLGEDESIAAAPVTGTDRLPVVAHLTERRGLAPRIMGRAQFFAAVLAMAERTEITRLSRPGESWTLEAALDQIEVIARGVSAQ